jgi:elongation factor Ts
MAEITAAAVKDLRERSGAGMMDCKKALAETNGDMEAAVDWLRAKGLAAAAKKSSRTAAEGLVGVAVAGTRGVAVEVNSETDFVAKNEQFQDFVRTAAVKALETGAADAEALAAAAHPAGGTIGNSGVVVDYVHNAAAPGLGKIGVLVALESEAGADVLQPLGKQIAMHIAAAFPISLDAAGIPADVIERERKIAAEKAAESGKPAEIVAKMVDGAIAKFAKENALLSQLFVMDNKTPVAEVVAKAAKEAGKPIALVDYVRFQLGEGIEKEESDFAAEVAAAAGV